MYPKALTKLIDELKNFPGVGSRTAERFAFRALEWPEEKRQQLAEAFATTGGELSHCDPCGTLIDKAGCPFCQQNRSDTQMCVVATPREVFAIEETGQYRGLYHVLGGTLSPIQGRGPEELRFSTLWPRLASVQEVIIALDSTLEGDTTALYLKRELEKFELTTTRLAFGLPAGCALDLADGGTLSRALSGRA